MTAERPRLRRSPSDLRGAGDPPDRLDEGRREAERPQRGPAPRADPRRRGRRPDRRRRRPRAPRGHRDPRRSRRPPRARPPADQRPRPSTSIPSCCRSFAAYITPDGHRARIDLTQADRIFSNDAMDQVQTLRRRLNDFLGEYEGIHVDRPDRRRQRRVGRHPRPDPRRPGPELVRRADRRLPRPAGRPARPAGVPQPGRDDGPDLRLRAGGDAPGLRHAAWAPRGSTGRSRTSCSCCWWPSGSTTTSS